MFNCGLGGTSARALTAMAMLGVAAAGAQAQTVTDPRVVEFLASSDHTAVRSDGQATVSGYTLGFYQQGASAPFQTLDLGKPAPSIDGIIRVDFSNRLVGWPLPGVTCESRVAAAGPGGTAWSTISNPFVMSACTYALSSSSASLPSTGGSGSVTVSVTSGSACSWTATSSASWLTIASGATGTGTGTVTYSAAANPTTAPRTGVLTIAGLQYTVTVAAAPASTVVNVSTEAELQAALRSVIANTTVVLAPGTYALSSTLQLTGPISNLTLRGSTGNAADVVIAGPGLTNASYGTTPIGIRASGDVQGLVLEHLTLRGFYTNGVRLDPGVQGVRISNVRFLDAGRQMLLVTRSATGTVNGGIVENARFEYSQSAPENGARAVDIRGGRDWIIRRNTFRTIAGASGVVAGPAVGATENAANTVVDANTFLNCQRGVALGAAVRSGFDHSGGLVRNNLFYRSSAIPGEAGISLADSPGTRVAHNSLLLSATYASPIEYRYATTIDVVIENNLLDGTIWARDGAVGDDSRNYTAAEASFFVNAPAGDLRLTSAAGSVVDVASVLTYVSLDFDSRSRPQGAGADMGAFETTIATNAPPQVTITAPKSGTTVWLHATTEIWASATDADGQIQRVEFYANSTLIGSSTGAPYSVDWRPPAAGSYTLTAVAIDNAGARTVSAAVTVTVSRKKK